MDGERPQLRPRGLADPAEPNAGLPQRRNQVALPQRRLRAHLLAHASGDLVEGGVGAAAVGRAHVEPRRRLALEAGHAHHEELIEAGRDERAQADALEQRHARILGDRHDPRVPVEP